MFSLLAPYTYNYNVTLLCQQLSANFWRNKAQILPDLGKPHFNLFTLLYFTKQMKCVERKINEVLT